MLRNSARLGCHLPSTTAAVEGMAHWAAAGLSKSLMCSPLPCVSKVQSRHAMISVKTHCLLLIAPVWQRTAVNDPKGPANIKQVVTAWPQAAGTLSKSCPSPILRKQPFPIPYDLMIVLLIPFIIGNTRNVYRPWLFPVLNLAKRKSRLGCRLSDGMSQNRRERMPDLAGTSVYRTSTSWKPWFSFINSGSRTTDCLFPNHWTDEKK